MFFCMDMIEMIGLLDKKECSSMWQGRVAIEMCFKLSDFGITILI